MLTLQKPKYLRRSTLAEIIEQLNPPSQNQKREELKLKPDGLTMDQVQNLTSILEAAFPYFHAGPKFWNQALTTWKGPNFEHYAGAVLELVLAKRQNSGIATPSLTGIHSIASARKASDV